MLFLAKLSVDKLDEIHVKLLGVTKILWRLTAIFISIGYKTQKTNLLKSRIGYASPTYPPTDYKTIYPKLEMGSVYRYHLPLSTMKIKLNY